MKRSVAFFAQFVQLPKPALLCALLLAAASALTSHAAAQDGQQSGAPNPYEGVSTPPPNSTITLPAPPKAKPAPGKPVSAAPSASPAPSGMVSIPDVVTGPESSSQQDEERSNTAVAPALATQPANPPYSALRQGEVDGTDSGIVQVEPDNQPVPDDQPRPALSRRLTAEYDPDGDIVHPAPLPPGTLDAGTIIRAKLLDGLSTAYSQDGETFRARVASDVFRDDQILIPAGAEIDGSISDVSTGRFAGHGSMLLHPETVTLPDGSRFHIYAELSATPDSNTRVGDEGNVTPGSRARKDELEYGGGVGVGVVAGAAMGGPAGALAGTIVGAGIVTVHLLLDHPQATLQPGTVLDFTLTQPLSLVADKTATASE